MNLQFPDHPVVPKTTPRACGGDSPWRERLKCAGFCILCHVLYEACIHWVF